MRTWCDPLRKCDLNCALISGHPVPLRLKFRVLENQHAADWNTDAAQWCLSQRFSLRPIDIDIRPRLGVDRKTHIKCYRCPRRLIAGDHMSNRSPQSAV